MWSAHLGGIIMSVWNASHCINIFDLDVGACAEEKCHIGTNKTKQIAVLYEIFLAKYMQKVQSLNKAHHG